MGLSLIKSYLKDLLGQRKRIQDKEDLALLDEAYDKKFLELKKS